MCYVDLPSKPVRATIWAIRTDGNAMKVMSGYLPSFKPFRSLRRGLWIVVVRGVGYSDTADGMLASILGICTCWRSLAVVL
jgi:hypothetical protein